MSQRLSQAVCILTLVLAVLTVCNRCQTPPSATRPTGTQGTPPALE